MYQYPKTVTDWDRADRVARQVVKGTKTKEDRQFAIQYWMWFSALDPGDKPQAHTASQEAIVAELEKLPKTIFKNKKHSELDDRQPAGK